MRNSFEKEKKNARVESFVYKRKKKSFSYV